MCEHSHADTPSAFGQEETATFLDAWALGASLPTAAPHFHPPGGHRKASRPFRTAAVFLGCGSWYKTVPHAVLSIPRRCGARFLRRDVCAMSLQSPCPNPVLCFCPHILAQAPASLALLAHSAGTLALHSALPPEEESLKCKSS